MNKKDARAREKALQAGETRYFTGLPCRHGHIAERYVSSGGCCACAGSSSAERKYRGNVIPAPAKPAVYTAFLLEQYWPKGNTR